MTTTQGSQSAGVGSARLSRDDVVALVRDALATVLERDATTITPQTTLADLGADSLALVEVAEIVEQQIAERTGHRLRIPDADLEAFRTVGDAAEFIAAWIE